jgi:hypothetical protein
MELEREDGGGLAYLKLLLLASVEEKYEPPVRITVDTKSEAFMVWHSPYVAENILRPSKHTICIILYFSILLHCIVQ